MRNISLDKYTCGDFSIIFFSHAFNNKYNNNNNFIFVKQKIKSIVFEIYIKIHAFISD